MINKATLEKLDYQKVLSNISVYASTENGKNSILNSFPLASVDKAIEIGQMVSTAKEMLIESDYPPIDFIPNLEIELARSKVVGSVLQIEVIKNILQLSITSRKLANYFKSNSQSNIFNIHKELLFLDRGFEAKISKIFNEAGNVSDSASSKLKSIRKEIISKNENLKNITNKILKQLSSSYLVQEEYVTQRDGRLVLPIKASHKRHIKGFIHSESNTGQTVYIEPEQTLELNNEILSLSFAEKREIEKILKEITVLIGTRADELKTTLNTVTELDSIFAKAQYSIEIIGAFPTFNNDKSFKIIQGRHPLLIKKLGRKETIPLDFTFEDDNVILITGPNAGGKTVVLKTIALLSLLAQSGIHIPIDPDSNLNFFEDVMLDIGDEQSIEDDLSTFSSHLSNIKSILENANDKALVLIDEIGTGTDPSEGTALAASFLITLSKKNTKVVATTHHGNLKILASELDKFQNASMEYDIENLMPTYKFRQGVPGSSYAFEVAQKIGLSKDIIELAEKYLDSDKNKIEKFIMELENKSLELSKKINSLEIENSRLQGLSKLYERENSKLKDQKGKILKDTREKAEIFLKDINSQFENTIKRIKETNAETEIIKEEKQKINSLKQEIIQSYQAEETIQNPNEKFKINDYVSIKDSSTTGSIVEIDKKIITIDTGNIRIRVNIKNVLHSKKVKEVENQKVLASSYSDASTSLDIRGWKPEEADFEVVKFIDDAYLANFKNVEIIHGKGTGVLRLTVHDILKNHELIENFELASIKFGGAGATVVTLKK
ncbi:MAG: endonuclease MutS2 [Ignavibacteriae bacterium]|nr:endonuclease MutS2 [Ignavibacteriota bacterium]